MNFQVLHLESTIAMIPTQVCVMLLHRSPIILDAPSIFHSEWLLSAFQPSTHHAGPIPLSSLKCRAWNWGRKCVNTHRQGQCFLWQTPRHPHGCRLTFPGYLLCAPGHWTCHAHALIHFIPTYNLQGRYWCQLYRGGIRGWERRHTFSKAMQSAWLQSTIFPIRLPQRGFESCRASSGKTSWEGWSSNCTLEKVPGRQDEYSENRWACDYCIVMIMFPCTSQIKCVNIINNNSLCSTDLQQVPPSILVLRKDNKLTLISFTAHWSEFLLSPLCEQEGRALLAFS